MPERPVHGAETERARGWSETGAGVSLTEHEREGGGGSREREREYDSLMDV